MTGDKQGIQVGFRLKGEKESKFENFFVIIFVLYSKIPYFSKEKLILVDAKTLFTLGNLEEERGNCEIPLGTPA